MSLNQGLDTMKGTLEFLLVDIIHLHLRLRWVGGRWNKMIELN
jgi:hypothetical protein